MTDNSDTPPDNKNKAGASTALENITNIENYILQSKGEIIQKLRLLAKGKSSITGYFNSGKDFFLTAIIDVLRDKNVLVLDISNDSALNNKVTQSDKIVFKTKHLGIQAQFTIDSIQTAKFHGQQYFACNIPENIIWVQRREFFRVRIPLSDNAVFQIKNDEDKLVEYPIIDVSGGGIAIADEKFNLQVEAGDEFTDAHLIFENGLSTTTDLTVQNTLPLDFNKPNNGQRIGCKFQNLRSDFSAELQRYINILDSHYRKTTSD